MKFLDHSGWGRLGAFVSSHPTFCDEPKYVRARMYYSRRFCKMHSSANRFVSFLGNLPILSCDAVVCLSCGQLVVKGDYVNAVKTFWVRCKYGVSWVVARMTGLPQEVTIDYNYSFWTKDLAQHLTDEELEENDIVRVAFNDEEIT